MQRKPTSLELIYFQVTDLWRILCEKHADLYDLTSDEYSALLENDLGRIENIVAQKSLLIESIGKVEELRQQLIGRLNLALANEVGQRHTLVTNVSELMKVMANVEPEITGKHLFQFNALLIDLIEKIQAQNKKNQIFINKALDSLRTIRENAIGEKKCMVYTSKGKTTSNTGRLTAKA